MELSASCECIEIHIIVYLQFQRWHFIFRPFLAFHIRALSETEMRGSQAVCQMTGGGRNQRVW